MPSDAVPQDPSADEPLIRILSESRKRGFIGPPPIRSQIAHSRGFLPGVEGARSVLDLGAGGGLPGLPLAVAMRGARFTLIDAAERKCRFLRWAVVELGLSERVTVVRGRAEDLARAEKWRGSHDAVVARSFGPPAVVAECARGFMSDGGRLVVSDPPPGEIPVGEPYVAGDRWASEGWRSPGRSAEHIGSEQLGSEQHSGSAGHSNGSIEPDDVLAQLSLAVESSYISHGYRAHFTILRAIGDCPNEVPRRVGVPGKRPLF